MKNHGLRFSFRPGSAPAWILISALIFSLGCTNLRLEKRARAMAGDQETPAIQLNRTVWLMPFTDDSYLKEKGLEWVLRQHVANYITVNFPKALFKDDKEDNRTSVPLLPSGEVDTYQLALQGRRKGVDAVVLGAIPEIRAEKRLTGFWWFEETVYYAVVHCNITMVDTETGAKIMDAYYSAEIKSSPARFEEIKKGDTNINLAEINAAINQLSLEAGEGIIDVLKNESAKIYLADVQGTRVKLTAGRNIGLFLFAELDVYAGPGLISGKDGRKFMVTGQKTGTVKIVSLEGEEATAEVIYGIVPNISACLKAKSK